MTAGTVQHYVAIVSLASARSRSTQAVYRNAHRGIRWQSTRSLQAINKYITTSDNIEATSNKFEIPADCFVDSPTFPKPSLDRSDAGTKFDLNLTRPAPLDSPPAPERRDYPDGSIPLGDRAKYLFKLGKSYILFYKTGLKNVWTNSKYYRELRRSFQGQPLNTVAKYGGHTINHKKIPKISRSQFQMSVRTRHDLFKMVPFSLVFLICGEFTPLVIVALGSSVVPYTCRIPRQEQNDIDKKIRRDQHYMEDLPRIYPEIETPVEVPYWRVEHLEAYRLGLTSFRTPAPILGQLYHTILTRPRLIRHLDNLVSDVLLIQREGGASKLTHQDIYEWADAYGLYALRQYIKQCQKTGQDPRSEKLKTVLLPKVDAEIKYMLNQIADWSRLKPSEQWRIGLRTVGSQSPDWKARVSDMRKQWKQG